MMQRNTQAQPPSENQQLEDARIAMEQAILRIGELEKRVDTYRRQYAALAAECDELKRQLDRSLPDGYESIDVYVREINEENSLFTYQSAERGFLLRDMLDMAKTHQGWILVAPFWERARAILDHPELAEERGKADRAAYQARVSSNQAEIGTAQSEETQLLSVPAALKTKEQSHVE
jgi:hypothetical protein